MGHLGHPTQATTVSFRRGNEFVLPLKDGQANCRGVDKKNPSGLTSSSEGVDNLSVGTDLKTESLLPSTTSTSVSEGATSASDLSEGETPSRDHLNMPTFANPDTIGLRRSARTTKPKILTCLFLLFGFETAASGFASVEIGMSVVDQSIAYATDLSRNIDGTINYLNPVSQVFASVQDNDTYTYRQAMQQSDNRDFVFAMNKEINDHHERKHWRIVMRDSVGYPKTILAIWSFKRKRFPNGIVSKHKARLCAHGGMQQWGVNFWETFSPVVNWMSVRLALILAIVHDLPARAIDFVLAFP